MTLLIETERLALRQLSLEDAEFILELVNDESFLRFVGDKRVRTLDDARAYIMSGPIASYERFGFGLYLVSLRENGAPVGICGLLKRDTLDDADVGFAFLPAFREMGYAFESASAVLMHARRVLGLNRILAVTASDNHASIHVLEKLGLRFDRMVKLTSDDVEIQLFASDAEPAVE